MQETYTIPSERRADVEKMIARIERKAAKYGKAIEVTFGNDYVKEIPYRVHDAREVETLWTVPTEVFDLTIDGEIIRKDGFTVVAEIEHLDGGNIVNVFEGAIKPEWIHAKGRCEHCNTNRARTKTFIVRGEDGSELQVGKTCLMDYCGINPQMIGYRNEIVEFLEDCCADRIGGASIPANISVFDTIKALAVAIRVYRKHGYIKSEEVNSNKSRVYDTLRDMVKHLCGDPTEEEIAEASKIAEIIRGMDDSDAIKFILSDTRSLIKANYCKTSHLGYIAYAPLAFERYEEELKRRSDRQARLNAERKSEWIGEVGKRVVFDISEMKLITSFETQYGMTHLYKFVTTDGNVLMWFASSIFGEWKRVGKHEQFFQITDCNQIKATIKSHNERDGVKQTIITRCAKVN